MAAAEKGRAHHRLLHEQWPGIGLALALVALLPACSARLSFLEPTIIEPTIVYVPSPAPPVVVRR
jgi:hypothetical protein